MKNESPLGEALKIINRRKIDKTIRVCGECAVPLIWTFAFSYRERYCLNCGTSGGMLGTGTDVPLTKELAFQNRIVQSIWKVIYGKKGLLPSGRFGKGGCKKDNKGGYESYCDDHNQHLTKSEKEYDDIARKYLASLQGLLSNKET